MLQYTKEPISGQSVAVQSSSAAWVKRCKGASVLMLRADGNYR
jgi:hypothetical protein